MKQVRRGLEDLGLEPVFWIVSQNENPQIGPTTSSVPQSSNTSKEQVFRVHTYRSVFRARTVHRELALDEYGTTVCFLEF